MKIAMVTADFLPNIGGIASHIAEISQAMARLGHEVRVWFHDHEHRPLVQVPGVLTEELTPAPGGWGPPAIRLSRQLAKSLRVRLADFRPDILHVHTLSPVSLSMRWLGPSPAYRRVLTNHSSGYLKMMDRWIDRRKAVFYNAAFDGLLAPSQELLGKSAILGLGTDRSQYIPNGVDPDRFQPGDRAAARAALGVAQDRVVLLSTRRFVVKNGVRYLALALDEVRRAVPNVLCLFCGDASDAEEMSEVKRIVRDQGLDGCVRLEGAIANDRIPLYLAAADLVVLPSLVEATSISGLEAMGCGRALVGTRVGGIPALIRDGETGLLVEPRDERALAAGLVRAITGCDLEAMGRASRQRVLDEFSWPAIARQTLGFFDRLRAKPPVRGARWFW
ncbi:MAG: glycosyltransferase family 4 protein [Phycisphaerae bacterium]|nr:glycosyltransferase family 4 protein [Phycisphaerae bacterium]